MNQSGLRWLLAIMGTLIVMRLLVPNAPVQIAVSEAVVRPALRASTSIEVMPASQFPAPPEVPSAQIDTPGNAFAARRPAIPLPAPTPMATKLAAVEPPSPPPQLTEPPPQLPPPPPPFKVIGTWDDKLEPGVFVATPVGTQLARRGTVLLAEYRVTAITPQQLSLEHLTSKREYQFQVPRAAGR